MSKFLGIDTSNYTTSACIYDSKNSDFLQSKKLLPVKKGEKGIRQSDAVFHHTVGLQEVISELFAENRDDIEAVGCSVTPTSEEGSYMPCFLSGKMLASSISCINKIPLFTFSHQQGHIAAVIAGAERFDLLKRQFIAFHISGGTTQALLVKPDAQKIFNIRLIASSTDLKAGQAIDRAGVMLGLDFPCGKELDRLSRQSNREFNIKPSLIGNNCSLSGIENKFKKMYENGDSKEDIARFCILSIVEAIDSMAKRLVEEYGDLPVLFSGGVSSNSLLRERLSEKYDSVFAPGEYSVDNAAGIAYLTYLQNKRND